MNTIPRTRIEEVASGRRRMDVLADDASRLGYEIVDIAGFLDNADGVAKGQADAIETARRSERKLAAAVADARTAADEVGRTTGTALTDANTSIDVIRRTVAETTRLAAWVGTMGQRLDSVEETLAAVRTATTQITAIASQVNILAINAKIEAARAGDAGRGFAVVAEAVNDLSHQTARAAQGIANSVADLTDWCEGLSKESAAIRNDAQGMLSTADANDAALGRISDGLRGAQTGTARIAEATESADAALGAFRPAFEGIVTGTATTAAAVMQARDRVDAMVDRSERIVQGTVDEGGSSVDARFITRVREDAARLSAALEAAVEARRIEIDGLFSEAYRPIHGTDPVQFMAPFTDLADTLFPEVQEAALAFDSKVVFCAAVDRNGYLPTHNRKFSQPPSDDPVWNAANCRNRRVFNDRVGLKAGRNTAPFLLQVYRRDMGGGEFKMMKDLSAPITVKGRHWGGLRLAYSF
jgi:methyl-accepting chemotaxis protein